jgi:signal transduction histidine kinase
MNRILVTVQIKFENDVVLARQRAKQLAVLLGIEPQDQTRFATAVSEIARNAFRYAGGGKIEFGLIDGAPMLAVRVTDTGPGIANLPLILGGQYVSKTGMGMGIIGSRRLVDRFEIESAPGKGTTVELGMTVRAGAAVSDQRISEITRQLSAHSPRSAFDEVQQQNQELLQALEALRAHQSEIDALNTKLRESNHGILALYKEIEVSNEHLKKASHLKTRFLSQMTHELRTPLNSVVMLSRMLVEQGDGPLHEEQLTQAMFIRKSSESLLELVNDLLDLAKIEAGKIEMRVTDFSMGDLFAALRGMFRPLIADHPAVTLDFQLPDPPAPMRTDEGKVAQVLRNLISNAIKFTTSGSVHVRAVVEPEGGAVAFSVSDTGPGISEEDMRRLFQDFTQLDSPAKKGIKGTGLGLSLSRQLATLLGGTLEASSEVGVGSTFTLHIPCTHSSVSPVQPILTGESEANHARN